MNKFQSLNTLATAQRHETVADILKGLPDHLQHGGKMMMCDLVYAIAHVASEVFERGSNGYPLKHKKLYMIDEQGKRVEVPKMEVIK